MRIFLHPMRCGHWRKSTNDREGSQYRNYDADQLLELVRASKNLYMYFSLQPGILKIENAIDART